jgi:hypothetical protein
VDVSPGSGAAGRIEYTDESLDDAADDEIDPR